MRRFLAVFALSMPLILLGCEQQGPMEEAGESVDEAVQDTGDAIEDAGEG